MATPHETKTDVDCRAEQFGRDSLPYAFRIWAKAIGIKTECCIPAIVDQYNRTSHKAIVVPLVKRTASDGQTYDRTPLNLTVWRWQTGGFLIDVPLFKGDTGWIVACDRDTTLAKAENGKIQDAKSGYGKDKTDANRGPQEIVGGDESTHVYECGFFIPDKWGEVKIPTGAEDSLVLEQIGRDGKSAGRFLLSQDGVLTFESDKTDGKVVIDPNDLDGKEARFRVKKAVVGIEDDNLKVRKSAVLSTESEDAEDIPLADIVKTDDRSIEFAEDGATKERRLQFLNFQKASEKGTTLADELKRKSDGDYHIVARKLVGGKWKVFYLKAGYGLGEGGGGVEAVDGHTIDRNGSDGSIELAEFQNDDTESGESRVDEVSVASEVSEAATGEEPKTDVDFQVLVRKAVGGVKKLYYKALGLFVTGVKPKDGDDRDAKAGIVSISAAYSDDGVTAPSVEFDQDNGSNGIIVKFPKPGDLSDGFDTPFQLVQTPEKDEGGLIIGYSGIVKNCIFHFNGVLRDELALQTFAIEKGKVLYLIGTPSATGEWTFTVDSTESSVDGAINLPLYSFNEDGSVRMDYRTTFMTLNSHEKKEEWDEPVADLANPQPGEGSSPTASVVVDTDATTKKKKLHFTFGIPKGATGDAGDTPIVELSDVEKSAAHPQGVKITVRPKAGANPTYEKVVYYGEDGEDGRSVGSVEQRSGTGQNPGETTTVDVKDTDGNNLGSFVVQPGQKGDKGDPGPMPEGFSRRKLSLNNGGHEVESTGFIAEKDFSIEEKFIEAGEGISLEGSSVNTIKISATAKAPPNTTIDYVINNRYNKTEKRFEKMMAHTNLSTGTTTYGSNYAETRDGALWEIWWNEDGSAETVPLTGVS